MPAPKAPETRVSDLWVELQNLVYNSTNNHRENTSVKFKHNKKKKVKGIESNKGALLSAFARRQLKIRTVAAIVGVRGTGLYLEADEGKIYVSTCYGKVKLQVRNSPSISEIVKTKRHDEPRFILKNENRIVEALILNHADLELIMLEKRVLRKPPFVGKDGKFKGGFYWNLSYKN